MSKGLEVLREMKSSLESRNPMVFSSQLDTIEKELKEYQQHEEILNDYGLTLANFREGCLLLAMLKGEGRNIHSIDKQLKALKVIKEKRVNAYNLTKYKTYNDYKLEWEINSNVFRETGNYNSFEISVYLLTQEEFDLLKEVLL